MVKNLPAVQETQVPSLSREGSLEKGMATHSSILAWRIPWTEELGYCPWGHSQSDTTEQLTQLLLYGKKELPTPFLPNPVSLGNHQSILNARDSVSVS